MIFERVFLEKDLQNDLQSKLILERLGNPKVSLIDRYDEVFGKVKKPYLQKRESLNLFIAKKKGALVKEAPDAYGLAGDPHYYFIHAYNCLYECDYCYLQGYFHSPDLVFFVNHEEILLEMEALIEKTPEGQTPWFHAGEFSDSLALSHLSQELPLYFDFFQKHSRAKMELRTKSANTKVLESLTPSKNIVVSFSLAPAEKVKSHDLKTPGLSTRLKAIRKLSDLGHPIAFHLDPIIYSETLKEDYIKLLEEICSLIPPKKIEYISVGVVRFTRDVFHQVKKNYPDSPFLSAELTKAPDNKIRYSRPMRSWILQNVKQICLDQGIEEKKVYLCME